MFYVQTIALLNLFLYFIYICSYTKIKLLNCSRNQQFYLQKMIAFVIEFLTFKLLYHIKMWILLLVAIFKLMLCSEEPIDSFGILTVTYARKGDYSTLQKYLKRYTQTDCYVEFLSQINLIWNNEQAPQETGILKRKQFWKIPVYFYRTTFNSMDHRYRLPKQSTAQLLYSLDDDIIVDCATFKATLQEYNRVGRGKLGRMVTNEVRGYMFNPSDQNPEYYYQGHANATYFTIAQPGAAFIPRHYLDLYYLKLNELVSIRKYVLDVKNCDDIFFYAFLLHFYPQLPAVYIKGSKDYLNTDPPVGQSKVKNVYQTRSRCISDISQVLGYNPLRYYSKNSTKYQKNWHFANIDAILSQRIAGLSGVQSDMGQERAYKQKQTPLVQKQYQLQKQRQQQQITKKELPTLKQPININDLHQAQQKKELQKQVKNSLRPPQTIAITPKSVSSQIDKRAERQKKSDDTQVQPLISQTIFVQLSFNQKVTGLSLLILFLLWVIYKLWSMNKKKQKGYTIQINQQDESNPPVNSIILPNY